MNEAQQFIWDRVFTVPECGCWLWEKSIKNGYGMARGQGAHRTSYEAFVGPIPKGKFICHKCNVGQCVNPEHLYIGDHSTNGRDRRNKKNDLRFAAFKEVVHRRNKPRRYTLAEVGRLMRILGAASQVQHALELEFAYGIDRRELRPDLGWVNHKKPMWIKSP